MEFSKVVSMLAVAGALTGCGSTEIREVPEPETPSAPTSDMHPLSQGEANVLVGDVTVRNDAHTLFVTVTAHSGLSVADVRICLGVSAFRFVAPEQCAYTAAIPSAPVSKATVAIPLADLGEPVAGEVIYVQAAAAISQKSVESKGFAYAGTFKGRIGYTVTGSETTPAGVCVLSAAEWAGGKKEWPAQSITLGGEEVRHDDLLEILTAPAAGDASLFLAKQIVAARLNEASGAVLPAGLANVLVMMESWLPAQADVDGSLPFQISATAGVLPNSQPFDEAVNLSEMIRQFNGGKLASPRCE